MTYHISPAKGAWRLLSLAEQLGNIGSEVHRVLKWQNKDETQCKVAIEKTLGLFDLTIDDSRWRGRIREIARAREVFCDAIYGGREYKSSLKDLDVYFCHFAILARLKQGV